MTLQEKYKQVTDAAAAEGISNLQVKEQGNVLYIDGEASNGGAKDKLWDIYNRIDPDFKAGDLVMNINVVAEATNTVASGLRNVVAGGGVQSLLSLFGSGSNKKGLLGNPIVSMMMGHLAGKLMNKFNMNNSQANNLSGSLIPNVLGSLINKTNDPNDQGFSLEKLLGSITGNKNIAGGQNSGGGGLLDQLKQFGGVGEGSGGGIMDIVKSLAGGAQQQQQKMAACWTL